jgi:hypothetical protein
MSQCLQLVGKRTKGKNFSVNPAYQDTNVEIRQIEFQCIVGISLKNTLLPVMILKSSKRWAWLSSTIDSASSDFVVMALLLLAGKIR